MTTPSMEIITLKQGSAEWHQHRARCLNASDAPAVLACSPYKSRSALVRERATGITLEVDAATQRRFDDGHRFEALARPLTEQIIGEELSPCVGRAGKFSASFDGLTFMCDMAWEHKTLNDTLRGAMQDGCTGADLPLHYRVQMEHQAMVSGCKRILFTASKWGEDDEFVEVRHCWYTPNPELRAQLLAGWAQFERDVQAYVPQEAAAPVVATPVESLPAVVVQMDGTLTVRGNLPAFTDALRAFIARIPQRPTNDQEFADCDAACKTLKAAEQALDTAEAGALAQVTDVEAMRRAVADLKALARTTRLTTEKLVAAEKEFRRETILQRAQNSMHKHIMELNSALQAEGAGQLSVPTPGAFAPCIKGLKSLDSMRDKVTAELVAQQAMAEQAATTLRTNRASLHRDGGDWIFLFPDFSAVGTKVPEDFAALAELRIARFRQEEAVRERAEAAARELERAQAVQIPKPAIALAEKAHSASKTIAVSGATLALNQINARLAPLSVSAACLSELGFEPVATAKGAKLYRESDFSAICRAIAECAIAAAQPAELAA